MMFSFLRNALDKTRLSVSSFRDVWTADNSTGLMTFQPAYSSSVTLLRMSCSVSRVKAPRSLPSVVCWYSRYEQWFLVVNLTNGSRCIVALDINFIILLASTVKGTSVNRRNLCISGVAFRPKRINPWTKRFSNFFPCWDLNSLCRGLSVDRRDYSIERCK